MFFFLRHVIHSGDLLSLVFICWRPLMILNFQLLENHMADCYYFGLEHLLDKGNVKCEMYYLTTPGPHGRNQIWKITTKLSKQFMPTSTYVAK